MMELVHVCDPEVEQCDTLCNGGPCSWNACAPGDDNCRRRLVATKCLFKPSYCPEAALRCQRCDEGQTCPAGSHCSDTAADDGTKRCVPGTDQAQAPHREKTTGAPVAHADGAGRGASPAALPSRAGGKAQDRGRSPVDLISGHLGARSGERVAGPSSAVQEGVKR
jgi:hypothetical protein